MLYFCIFNSAYMLCAQTTPTRKTISVGLGNFWPGFFELKDQGFDHCTLFITFMGRSRAPPERFCVAPAFHRHQGWARHTLSQPLLSVLPELHKDGHTATGTISVSSWDVWSCSLAWPIKTSFTELSCQRICPSNQNQNKNSKAVSRKAFVVVVVADLILAIR